MQKNSDIDTYTSIHKLLDPKTVLTIERMPQLHAHMYWQEGTAYPWLSVGSLGWRGGGCRQFISMRMRTGCSVSLRPVLSRMDSGRSKKGRIYFSALVHRVLTPTMVSGYVYAATVSMDQSDIDIMCRVVLFNLADIPKL